MLVNLITRNIIFVKPPSEANQGLDSLDDSDYSLLRGAGISIEFTKHYIIIVLQKLIKKKCLKVNYMYCLLYPPTESPMNAKTKEFCFHFILFYPKTGSVHHISTVVH